MILPTRITPIDRCVLAGGAAILKFLGNRPRSVSFLWQELKNTPNLNSFSRFILSLDLLYVLGAITINEENGLIHKEH